MRQTELRLTEEDRVVIDGIRMKGVHQSREVNRAHVLSSLDQGVPEAQIMAVLGIGRTAVWRTRAAYLQGGVELAVFDMARSGRPRPVRRRCRSPGDSTGLHGRARRKTALDTGGTRTCRAPRARPGQREPRDGATHAKKNDIKPCRRLMCSCPRESGRSNRAPIRWTPSVRSRRSVRRGFVRPRAVVHLGCVAGTDSRHIQGRRLPGCLTVVRG